MAKTKFYFRERRPDTRFRGVYYRPEANATRPYVAWVCCNGQVIQLGYFAQDDHAALVADYARYLLWGPFPKAWYSGRRRRRVEGPNLPQSILTKLLCDHQQIAFKLYRTGAITQELLDRNRVAYEQIAIFLSGKSA